MPGAGSGYVPKRGRIAQQLAIAAELNPMNQEVSAQPSLLFSLVSVLALVLGFPPPAPWSLTSGFVLRKEAK